MFELRSRKLLEKSKVISQYRSGIMSAQKILKGDLKNYFLNKGFKLIEMNQHFRNAYGKLIHGKSTYFLRSHHRPQIALR